MAEVTTARLATNDLPEFGRPAAAPELPPDIYAERLARLRRRAVERGLDAVVVYADREHSANVAYLSGFDPRFEEAILVVDPRRDDEPAILVGNECWGTAGAAPLPMRRHRFQDLSLPNQPRDRSRPLAEILAEEGAGTGRRIGIVGWKTYARPDMTDAPSYLVDASWQATAARSRTPRICSSTPPMASGSSTRPSSWRRSSTPPARRRTGSATSSSISGPG